MPDNSTPETMTATPDDLRAVAEYRRSFRMTHPTPEGIESLADAIDTLREAYVGCEEGSRTHGIRCGGTYPNGSHEFCAEHETMFWGAIDRLLGTTESGGVDG